jgi:large subunit ribosomal protein L5
MNPERQIKIEKITLNIGVGKSSDKLDKGLVLLEKVTQLKPVKTLSKKRIAGWGLRPGLPIGCKVTIRGEKTEQLLKQLLGATENKLKKSQFDNEGNVSFGIPEYIDIPGIEYDPAIGVIGLQACVTLGRPGFRIKIRRIQRAKVGAKHRIRREDAIEYFKQKFNVKVEAQ